MTNYDVHVRADVHGTKVILGTQCNIHDLSKGRHFARFRNSVTVRFFVFCFCFDWVCIHSKNQKTENKIIVESLCVRIAIRYLRFENLHLICYYPYHCILIILIIVYLRSKQI